MPHDCDLGYPVDGYRELVNDYPGEDAYPHADFRTEWGPIFHRGRLDGTARVLIIGQDPAQHEAVVRRILVGEAGQRIQGFLNHLGITRSYVMVNAFLYSVYGQKGGERHRGSEPIARYRNRWLAAILSRNPIEAVIALGSLADTAWTSYTATLAPGTRGPAHAHITHPTQPESAARSGATTVTAAIRALLENWNAALGRLRPEVKHPDLPMPAGLYGTAFQKADLPDIPECDFPAGCPAWMRAGLAWAIRAGPNKEEKRYTIAIRVPPSLRP